MTVRRVLNAQRVPRDVVVVGASAGGVPALTQLLANLPVALPAAMAIVLHRSPFYETQLPAVLGRRARLRVVEPEDGAEVQPSMVYVAPRDMHMVFEDGVIRLHRGPKEHRTRPAIDPLFRSAAAVYGRRTVGVLLTGMGADGVPGLIDIKAAGGISLVQDPKEAQHPMMPRNAIADDDVDAVLSLEDLAIAVTALTRGEACDDAVIQASAG